MTTSHWRRLNSSGPSDVRADIAIVGGGYAGLATAFWISEMKPDCKIAIIERSFCGAGASGRNAGFLTMGSASFYKSLTLKWGKEKALKIFQFAANSLELVHEKILKTSPEIAFEKSSSMTLFRTEKQLSEWSHKDFSPEEFHFYWKSQEKIPQALQGRFAGAFEASPEYKINPTELLGAIRKKLETRNVQFIENSSGFEVTSEGVRTETGVVLANKVVLALNGYFPQFHKAFSETIVPRRAQMLAVKLNQNFDCPSLYYDPPERVYWRKTQDNVLVVGGKRLLDEEGETGDFEKISPVIQNALEEYLREQLGINYTVLHRWSGTMGFTDHELPLIGKISGPNNCYMIGGFSGHGMGLGFHSSKEMAEIVTGQKEESFFNQFMQTKFTL